jgi:cell division protein FtsW (lipid II flippase)
MIRPGRGGQPVEFLNLVVIFVTACLVLRKPQKERLAFGLLVFSVLLMVFLFSVATRTGLLPGMNY